MLPRIRLGLDQEIQGGKPLFKPGRTARSSRLWSIHEEERETEVSKKYPKKGVGTGALEINILAGEAKTKSKPKKPITVLNF